MSDGLSSFDRSAITYRVSWGSNWAQKVVPPAGTRHWEGELCRCCQGMLRFRKYEFSTVKCRGLSCLDWRDSPAQVFLVLLLPPLSSSCPFFAAWLCYLHHITISLLHPIHSVSTLATKLLFTLSILFHPASVLSTSVSSDLSL